jgi:hypothetical protein
VLNGREQEVNILGMIFPRVNKLITDPQKIPGLWDFFAAEGMDTDPQR